MKKQVLINVEDVDIRVAVLEDGRLSQLFVESTSEKGVVGNIYKGRVESIVPGLKAVFVDIGMERNAFLHFSDVRQEYQLPDKGAPQRSPRAKSKDAKDLDGQVEIEEGALTVTPAEDHTRKKATKPRSLQLKIGDEILVQVTKEPYGEKGARVTSYITLPGRYLVFMPYSEKEGGVSRRIEDNVERDRLRTILRSLRAKDMEGSFIIRTAGLNQNEDFITSDVKKLMKLWQRIRRQSLQGAAPTLVHDEHEILSRLVRDEMGEDVDELVIDSKTHARVLRAELGAVIPSLRKKVTVLEDAKESLFEKYDVESQFQRALRRKVWLKSGGHIVIEEAEALVVIDVNTGKFVGREDQESTILQNNLEAAEAIAQQLRLRDLGGIIVIDFIDMKRRENQHKLLKTFKELLKSDRAKTTVVPLTEYGLMQMTRKRVRQSLSKVMFQPCPYCEGTGKVLNHAQIWKNLKYQILGYLHEHPKAVSLQVAVHPDLRRYLENEMLDAARNIANRCKVALSFMDDKECHLEQFNIVSVEESMPKPKSRSRKRGSRKKTEKTLEKEAPKAE